MYRSVRGLGRVGRLKALRGLGTIATAVNGSMILSSNPVGPTFGSKPLRHVAPTLVPSPTIPTWGSNPPGPVWSGSGSTGTWQTGGQGWQSGGQGWQANPGNGGGGGWSAGGSVYGSSPLNPSGASTQALAAAQILLQTNPGLLTQQQFTLLQQAGLVSNTIPYSEVSQITPTSSALTTSTATVNDPNCVAAGCTGGPYPNCTCAAAASSDLGTTLSTDYAGVPLYGWLAGGGLLLFMFMGKRR
jgi:hypothetical protein